MIGNLYSTSTSSVLMNIKAKNKSSVNSMVYISVNCVTQKAVSNIEMIWIRSTFWDCAQLWLVNSLLAANSYAQFIISIRKVCFLQID